MESGLVVPEGIGAVQHQHMQMNIEIQGRSKVDLRVLDVLDELIGEITAGASLGRYATLLNSSNCIKINC